MLCFKSAKNGVSHKASFLCYKYLRVEALCFAHAFDSQIRSAIARNGCQS